MLSVMGKNTSGRQIAGPKMSLARTRELEEVIGCIKWSVNSLEIETQHSEGRKREGGLESFKNIDEGRC